MYYGFYFPCERYADDRKFYERCIKDNTFNIFPYHVAKRNLKFAELFSPEKEHSRLMGHNIEVFKYNNLEWENRGELNLPKGNLEKILSSKVHYLVSSACEDEHNQERVIEKMVEIVLDDGTVVKGTRYQRSINDGPIQRRILPHKHLGIWYNSKNYENKGEYTYQFEPVIKDEPFLFNITEFVEIDNVRYKENVINLTPTFNNNKFVRFWQTNDETINMLKKDL